MPVAAFLPAFSAIVDGLRLTVSVFATSMFVTVRVAVPGVYPDPGAEAVIVTLLGDVSAMPSSTALMANGRRSLPGQNRQRSRSTVAWAVLLLVRLTTKSEVGATDTVTVPVAAFVPSPSVIVDGLSWTVSVLHGDVVDRGAGRVERYFRFPAAS